MFIGNLGLYMCEQIKFSEFDWNVHNTIAQITFSIPLFRKDLNRMIQSTDLSPLEIRGKSIESSTKQL